MCGVIQYINAAGEGRIYPIPFYDLDTCSDENLMLFPWCIEGEATKKAGNVQFSVRFYKLDTSGSYLLYNLNTLPATSRVEQGMEFKYDDVYNEIVLTSQNYQKGKYYTLNPKNGTYNLCTDDFDASQTYYEKTTLNGDMTDWAAGFMDQLIAESAKMAEHELTWVVI